MAQANRWTREQLIAAFTLYCQLPFGRLHRGTPEVIALAHAINRTPSAVALKLVNFASFDPAILASGRSGMSNVSALDREIWDEFHADWNGYAVNGELFLEGAGAAPTLPNDTEVEPDTFPEGTTREVIITVRRQQGFFRRTVLSSYRTQCCMSGIVDERLLTASHIVPWALDQHNRLNPRNGLCLSALHDRAFDRFLLTVLPDGTIRVSASIGRQSASLIMQAALLDLDGQHITLPERFQPDPVLLRWHNAQFAARNTGASLI